MTQQLSQFATQVDESLTYLEIILGIIVDTLRILSHIQLAAQFALGAVGHKGRIRGEVECKYPPLFLLFLGCQSCRLASSIGKAIKLSLVGNMQCKGLVLL